MLELSKKKFCSKVKFRGMSLSQFFLQILRDYKNVKKNKKVQLQIKSLHINVMSRNIMTLESN